MNASTREPADETGVADAPAEQPPTTDEAPKKGRTRGAFPTFFDSASHRGRYERDSILPGEPEVEELYRDDGSVFLRRKG